MWAGPARSCLRGLLSYGIITGALSSSPALPTTDEASIPAVLAGDREAAGFADLFFSRGLLAWSQGDLLAALAQFDRAVAAAPRDGTYHYFRGLCLRRLERLPEAIEAFRSALPPAPSSIETAQSYADLAATLLLAKRDAEARPILQRVRTLDDQIDPNDACSALELSREPCLATLQQRSGLEAYRLPPLAPPHGNLPAPFDARVSLAYEDDNNPAFLTQDTLTLIDFLGEERFGRPVADRRSSLQLRGSWLPWIERRGWTVALTGQTFLSRHAELSQLDSRGVGGLISATRGGTPNGVMLAPLGYARVVEQPHGLAWGLQFAANRFDVDRSRLVHDVEAAATGLWTWTRFGSTQVDLIYEEPHFAGAADVVSGGATTFRLSHLLPLGDSPSRSLRFAVARAHRDAKQNDFERRDRQLSIEGSWSIGSKVVLLVSTAATRIHFDDFQGVSRRDRRRELRGTIAVVAAPHLYFTLRYSQTRLRTAPATLAEAFRYDRRVLGVGATFHW